MKKPQYFPTAFRLLRRDMSVFHARYFFSRNHVAETGHISHLPFFSAVSSPHFCRFVYWSVLPSFVLLPVSLSSASVSPCCVTSTSIVWCDTQVIELVNHHRLDTPA